VWWAEFGLEGLHEAPLLVDQVVTGQTGEDVQDAGGGRRGAAAVLGVDGQLVDSVFGHGGADLASDEGLDEHRDEVAAQQALDPGRVVEEDRGDELRALELGMPLLQVGLPLVGGPQRGLGQGPGRC
jgi:hypothetical protein